MAQKLLIQNRTVFRIILLMAMSMLLPGILLARQDPSGLKRPEGGILRWGVCQRPAAIDPVLTTSTVSAALVQLVFNSLVRINPQGKIEPDLAYSWDVSSDARVYTFYLRKGVRFHDGRELTADDVKFTFDKIMDPGTRSPLRSAYESVESFESLDAYRFQIRLKRPSSAFLYRMVRYIIPKHIYGFNSNPVGSGPFRFKQWTKDDRIILEYNPDYYEGRPYLERIEVRVYPNSRDAWTAFMRQEVDLVLFIEREDYEVVKNDPAFKAYAFAVDNYCALVYNLEDPLLTDIKVREAIAYGVDRKGLIERAGFGYGVESAGPFKYSPQKARELLAQAGFRDRNNDGILERDGEELVIKVLADAREGIYERIIMVLRQQLQEAGIKLKVVFYDDSGLPGKDYLKEHNIQAHLTFLYGGPLLDQQSDLWDSRKEKKGRHWTYRSPEVDRLFDSGEGILDEAKKNDVYGQIHKIILKEHPVCALYYPIVFHALSGSFENTEEFFSLNMPHYTMKDWYARTDIKKGGER